MSKIMRFTVSEVKAWKLLHQAGHYQLTTDTNHKEFHEAGNQIIALAEQIKAERQVVSMQLWPETQPNYEVLPGELKSDATLDVIKCDMCSGSGEVSQHNTTTGNQMCPKCKGTGYVQK